MSVKIEIIGDEEGKLLTPEISKGDKFYCEGIMYEIVRGKMTFSGFFSNQKSNNFQVKQLKWKEHSTTIESLNNTKNVINRTTYKLSGEGNPHKFVPFKKYSYVVCPFKEAVMSIDWQTHKQRDDELKNLDMDYHFQQ